MKLQYLKMPYDLLINRELGNNIKMIYLALLYFRNGVNKKIKVPLEKISALIGIKKRQLINHLNILVENNIISRSQENRQSGEYICNTYTILVNESHFALIPVAIAVNYELSANAKIRYCIMKRFSNPAKKNFTCHLKKTELAHEIGCSLNEVDKIKRSLKNAGLIEYERNDNQIILIYERNLKSFANSNQEIKQTVRNKNKVSLNESNATTF